MLRSFRESIKSRWREAHERSSETSTPKQKVVIILITVALAFLLWLVVNLNRSYTINLKVPIVLGQVSSEKALAEELPESVTASVSGEGWDLFTMYQNPPSVFLEVSGQQVNLFEQVRRQVHATSNLTVQKVDPLYLQLQLQEKVSKKIPVVAQVDTDFASQFGFLEPPKLQPDSVTVIGARSIVDGIDYWATDSLTLKNINNSFSVEIPLKEAGSLITLSEQNVRFTGEVAQYTEGEVTVPVELRNYQLGQNVIFSPSAVSITFLAPIKEFPELEDRNLFAAYVTHSTLTQDTTGFVSPEIEQLAEEAHLKVQQVQPPQVAYFSVVSDSKIDTGQ